MAGDLRSNAAKHPDDADERAIDWDFVYDEHSPRIRRIIERRAGTSMADDLLQETFERALRGESRFDLDRPMAPWLNTIAFHLTSDLRRQRAAAAGEVLVDEPPEVVGPDAAEEAYVARVRRIGIRLAFESLTHRHRRVLQLIAVEGMTSEQVAEFEHMSTEAVKSVLARARVNFRTTYTEFVEKMGVFGGAIVGPMVLRLRARLERYADVATNHAGAITIAAVATAMVSMASVPATNPNLTKAREEPRISVTGAVSVVERPPSAEEQPPSGGTALNQSGEAKQTLGTPPPEDATAGSAEVRAEAIAGRDGNGAVARVSGEGSAGHSETRAWGGIEITNCDATMTTRLQCAALAAGHTLTD